MHAHHCVNYKTQISRTKQSDIFSLMGLTFYLLRNAVQPFYFKFITKILRVMH